MADATHIHIHLHLTIEPGGIAYLTSGDDDHIATSTDGEPSTSTAATSDSAPPDGALRGAPLEAAIQRLGRSGASPNTRLTAETLRSLGYEFLPATSKSGGPPENYLRVIDPQRSTIAVAYLMPTYLEFTPYGLELVSDLASLPGAETRDWGLKFSHIRSAKPALDAAKLFLEQSRNTGS